MGSTMAAVEEGTSAVVVSTTGSLEAGAAAVSEVTALSTVVGFSAFATFSFFSGELLKIPEIRAKSPFFSYDRI